MSEDRVCPQCGAETPAGTPEQPCPACLMKLGLESWSGLGEAGTQAHVGPGSFEPLPVADIARRFPQLEVLELLGKGGMGAVYKARQKSLDRLVALKVIHPQSADNVNFAQRFAREAKSLARLNHPHIVTVHDFGQSDGLYYFLMEHVEGANVRELLRTGGLTPRGAGNRPAAVRCPAVRP